MRNLLPALPLALAALSPMLSAAADPAPPAKPALPAPADIVAAAPVSEWVDIPADDLMVMTLAPDARGKPRRVIIQLMPAPFSQGWVGNMRLLAKTHWYDGIAVVRVQDDYVTQWGDPDGEDEKKAKALPAGIKVVPESAYTALFPVGARDTAIGALPNRVARTDAYAGKVFFSKGWPLASNALPSASLASAQTGNPVPPPSEEPAWPLHCYGMVGVGRNLSPDTGTGAELYTVIGHAPRQLDRNIALVGRVVEGMEHLSSLPRGTGRLGFYETAEERTPILSVRLASDLPAAEQPHLHYLSTESASFARYAELRANRHDNFYKAPAGGADICNIPVPLRRKP